jgi:hypothetical protein
VKTHNAFKEYKDTYLEKLKEAVKDLDVQKQFAEKEDTKERAETQENKNKDGETEWEAQVTEYFQSLNVFPDAPEAQKELLHDWKEKKKKWDKVISDYKVELEALMQELGYNPDDYDVQRWEAFRIEKNAYEKKKRDYERKREKERKFDHTIMESYLYRKNKDGENSPGDKDAKDANIKVMDCYYSRKREYEDYIKIKKKKKRENEDYIKDEDVAYPVIFTEAQGSNLGLKWREVGTEKPPTGTEIVNELLAAELKKKVDLRHSLGAELQKQVEVEFKQAEWKKIQIRNRTSDTTQQSQPLLLSIESYIKAADRYFKPAAETIIDQPLEYRPEIDTNGYDKEGQEMYYTLKKNIKLYPKYEEKMIEFERFNTMMRINCVDDVLNLEYERIKDKHERHERAQNIIDDATMDDTDPKKWTPEEKLKQKEAKKTLQEYKLDPWEKKFFEKCECTTTDDGKYYVLKTCCEMPLICQPKPTEPSLACCAAGIKKFKNDKGDGRNICTGNPEWKKENPRLAPMELRYSSRSSIKKMEIICKAIKAEKRKVANALESVLTEPLKEYFGGQVRDIPL